MALSLTQLDSLEHNTTYGSYNSVALLDSSHLVLAYTDTDSDGRVATFSFDSNYDLTELDELEHETATGDHNSVAVLDSTHFAVAYAGANGDGFIKTFSVDGSYNITEIDSLEHDINSGNSSSLVALDSTHLFLAYYDGTTGRRTKTFTIDGSYNISQTDTNDDGAGFITLYTSVDKIDSSHVVVTQHERNSSTFDLQVSSATYSVDGSYNITQEDVLSHNADTGSNAQPAVTVIDSTHFMVAYTGPGGDGFVATCSVDGSYNITGIDTLEHDTSTATYSSITALDTSNILLAYESNVSSGDLVHFTIDGSYNITESSALTYDATGALYNSIVKIDSAHCAVAFRGADSDGFINTFVLADTPTMDTQAATSVSYTSATLNGEVTDDGNATLTERGFAYNTTGTPTTADNTVSESGSFNEGTYSLNATGLTDNTLYYVRAYGINSEGTSYGDEVTFTTLEYLPPTLDTKATSPIGGIDATANGEITDTKGQNATTRGFAYNTTGTPTTADSTVLETGNFTAGTYDLSIGGLSPDTLYYIRAYAINPEGTGYGDEETFTTESPVTPVSPDDIKLEDGNG
jgi:hypothetical protein